jgi:hypothetical protein
MAYEYESNQGKVSGKVMGTEVIELPAGKFACLAIVREREADGTKTVENNWITPGVGIVKISGEDFVMTLAQVINEMRQGTISRSVTNSVPGAECSDTPAAAGIARSGRA